MKFHLIKVIVLLLMSGMFDVTSAVFSPPDDPQDTDESGLADNVPWTANWDSVVRCKPGEKHSKFPRCTCGRFAKKLEAESVYGGETGLDDLESEGIFFKWKGTRKIFYVCLACTGCPDGVRVKGFCGQGHDTSCEPLECVDPNHVFDRGLKACVPNPTATLALPVVPIEGHIRNSTDRAAPIRSVPSPSLETDNDNEDDNMMKQTREFDDLLSVATIVMGVIATVLALGIYVLFGCVIYPRHRRQRTLNRAPSDLSLVSSTSQTANCMCLETAV